MTRKVNTSAVETVRSMVFNTIGHQCPGAMTVPHAKWETLPAVELSPAMCGPVAAMFLDLCVQVKYGLVGDTHVACEFNYQYTHRDGGRNGHTVRIQEKI